jgi:golgin subfamily B member 1
MSRKDDLLKKLKEAPTNKSAMDNLVAFFSQRGDFQALYESLRDVVEGMDDRGLLAEFRGKLVDVVKRHLDSAADPIMAANVKLRLAGLLFDRSTQSKEAIILVTEAFERLPSDEVAQRAVHMLKEMSLARFVVLVLKLKAAGDSGSGRRADTLFQLGHAALAAGNVNLAQSSFEDLRSEFKNWADKADEGLQQTVEATKELEQNLATLEDEVREANDIEKPTLQTRQGRLLIDLGRSDDGISLLEKVMDDSPSDQVCMELVAAYKEQESWAALVELVDQWSEQVTDDESKRELLKERARVFTLKLDDKKRGYAALADLYKSYPGNADVVEFCVNVYSACDDHDALAALLGKARQDTRDRDQERRYLEWEAALKWRKLGDLEAAEKLYRRIKSIDPRNEPALLFYEEYTREKGDFRKLHSILSTRQSLAPESQKSRILKQMAELARDQLNSPDRAIDALKKVLVFDPNDEEAFEQLSDLLEDTRRWHAVIEHYSSKVDRLSEHDVARKLELLERVRDIYASKDKQPVPEMVVTTFRRMLQIDPMHGESIEALGEYYRKNNRWGELTEILERKVELETDTSVQVALHKEIAQILIEYQHQETAAVPHLEQVVDFDPDDDEAVGLLAKAYRGRGEFEKFFVVGNKLLDRVTGREQTELLEELSTIAMERLQLEDEAALLLERLFAAEPKHPWALRRLQQLYEKLEKYEELADVFQRGIELAPSTKQRSLKEKLGAVWSDKLRRYDDAKAIFAELLEENPGNRQARQYLQRIHAQAGEFAELEAIYTKDKNVPGLMRFLDEFRLKDSDPERAKAAGLEMVRVADEVLKDKPKGRQTLEALLEQFPEDADLARRLLAAYPARKADMDVAKALAVLADNADGQEAHDAAVRLADVLAKNGEHEAAYTRTLGLFLRTARDGDYDQLDAVADRAEASDSLDGFAMVLESLLEEGMPAAAREELILQMAKIHLGRRKDVARAREILEAELQTSPDSIPILRELERIHMGASNWSELETVVRAMADQMLDLDEKKVELHKLARLYDEIVGDAAKAAEVFQELRELDPSDDEAYAGLKRSHEELENWAELAVVLEDELQVADEEQALENLLQLAALQRGRLDDVDAAAETLSRLLELAPEDAGAWAAISSFFEADEALSVVLPMLENRYRTAESWEELVEVLAKSGQIEESDEARFEILGQCAEILEEQLNRPDEAFSYLSVMVSMDPSKDGLIPRLEGVGRVAEKSAERYAIYKGLLGIGESDFVPLNSLDEAREQEVALLLASLAEEHDESDIAVEALKRARLVAPGEIDLFERLEGLYEAGGRNEDLLALLEEKREYVWDEDEKIGLFARVADILANRLDREEEAITWLEELFALTGQSSHVAERLEALYLKFERWSEMAPLLRGKMAHLEGELRSAVAYQLAVVLRDHLGDLQGAFDLFSEILTREPENEACVEALSFLLGMRDADGYDTIVLKVVEVLEPLAREREDWVRLVDVLEVKATNAPEEKAAANAWLELGRTCRERLDEPARAMEAFGAAVQAQPSNQEALDALLGAAGEGGEGGTSESVVAALETAIGDVQSSSEIKALAALAGLLREAGEDLPRATQTYERLTELAPDTLEYYEALDQLYGLQEDSKGRIRILGDMVERLEGPRRAEVLVELAQLLLVEEQQGDAIDALYRAVEIPDHLDEERRPLAFHLLEEALEAEERWFDLCEVIGRRIGFARDLGEEKALRYRAALLEEERLDNYDNAITHYFAIVNVDATETAASGALIRLLESAGRHQDLEELLALQVEITDDIDRTRDLLLRLAKIRLTELGNAESAVDALSRLIENLYFEDPALELLDEVVEEAPDAGYRATQLLETACNETGQYERLAEVYKTQIDRFADEVDRVERFRALATLYETQFHDVDTAFIYISQAFKLEPNSQAIHDQLISYAKERAGFDELFDIYLDVLVQLDEAEGRNNLRTKMVEIYHDELDDLDHAEMIYRDMLDDEADNEFALDRLQKLYHEQEKWDEVIDVLRTRVEVARSDKARISTLYDIATLYRENTGDLAESLDTYEQILSLDVTESDAYRGIESIYFERGDVQSVTATLRRELDVCEDETDRREARLRLAAIHFTELEEHGQAVEELALVLEEAPLEEGALELLAEVVAAWDSPSEEAAGLLIKAYTEQEDWGALIALYQSLAARAVGEEERVSYFRHIYDIRTEKQDDQVGAYAATKIMCTLDPSDPVTRVRLLEHGGAVGEFEDLAEFLQGILDHEAVSGTDMEVEFQILLARIFQDNLDNAPASCQYYELVAEGSQPEYVAESRQQLRVLYQELEAWEKYVILLELMAGEAPDVKVRKNFLLEAALVAWKTVEDTDRAQEILLLATEEFGDDEAVLDRYEQLLTETRKVEELEELLRSRVDLTADPEARGDVRLRLGNLLLNLDERSGEGVEELLAALDEAPGKEVLWRILEALLGSDDTEPEERLKIAEVLEERYPEETPVDRVRTTMETHLTLVDDVAETDGLHRRLGALLEEIDSEQAYMHFAQSMRLAPGVAEVEEKVAVLARSLEIWEDFRDLLQEVAQLTEDEAQSTRYLLAAAQVEENELESIEAAATIWERVLEIDEFNRLALASLARHYEAQGAHEDRVRIIEQQIALEEDAAQRVETTALLARLYGDELENLDRARHWWEELLHEPAVRTESCARLEDIYRQQEEWELLCDLLLEVREETTETEELRMVMTKLAGLYEQYLERTEEAFHWYRELLNLDGDFAPALHGARRCATELDDWQTVADVDARLIDLSDDDDEVAGLRQELAVILVDRLGNKRDGLEILQVLLAAEEVPEDIKKLALSQVDDPEIGFQISLALEPLLEAAGDWDQLSQIIEAQLEALAGVEEKVPIALRLVDIFVEQLQESERAFDLLSGLLEQAPDSSPLLEKLSELTESTGEWQRYVEVLESVHGYASSTDQLSLLGLLIADLYSGQLEDVDRALEWNRRVLEDVPAQPEAIARLEALMQTHERFDELVQFYEAISFDVEPEERVAYLLKQGFIKEGKLEDLAGAVESYREVLVSDPDNDAALGRLDGLLENPILGLAAVEILEPIYRQQDEPAKLARLLRIKAQEVEGSLDRSQLLAEAANLLASTDGGMADGFETYLQAIKQKQFDSEGTLAAAMGLAAKLDRWQDLANVLDQVCLDDLAKDLKLEALRHLALIYDEKLSNNNLAELKLRELLKLDSESSFALTRLARLLEDQGENDELMEVLEQLGQQTVDVAEKRQYYERAAGLATAQEAFDKAAKLYTRALQVAPDDAELMDNLANLHRLAENWSELVEILESRANLLEPEEAIGSLLEATHIAATNMEAPARALALCRLVLERDEANLDALAYMVDILKEQGKVQEQLVAQERLAEHLSGEEQVRALFELKELALSSGDTEGAVAYVQRILAADPDNEEAQAAQLTLLRDGENLYSLVAKLEEQANATDDVVRKVELLFEVANTLAEEIGDPGAAIEKLAAIRELQPNYLPAVNKSAQLLVQQREFGEAIDAYLELAKLLGAEDQVTALKTAATIALEEQSDPEQAAGILRRVIETNPDDAEALDLLVRCLEVQEAWNDLAALLKNAIGDTTDPSRKASLCRNLALVHRDGLDNEELFLNWLEEAHQIEEDPELVEELLAHYRKADNQARVAPLLAWKVNFLTGRKQLRDVPGLLLELGKLEHQLGNGDKALAALRNAVELDGSFLNGVHALAMLLFDEGEMEEAFSHFQTLLLRINELDSKDEKVLVYLRLASIYLDRGDKKRTKTYLNRLLSLDKQHAEAKELLKSL